MILADPLQTVSRRPTIRFQWTPRQNQQVDLCSMWIPGQNNMWIYDQFGFRSLGSDQGIHFGIHQDVCARQLWLPLDSGRMEANLKKLERFDHRRRHFQADWGPIAKVFPTLTVHPSVPRCGGCAGGPGAGLFWLRGGEPPGQGQLSPADHAGRPHPAAQTGQPLSGERRPPPAAPGAQVQPENVSRNVSSG